MRIERTNPTADKGWYAGHWNSDLTISVGYANKGIDEPHVHHRITEIYLVARGTSEMRVEQKTVFLEDGDMIIIEPGEAHTFLSSSPEYLHFVIHVPGLPAEEVRAERSSVPRSRLWLR
jgi:mannose-6-phosphate isomerase-like protein (cupin superfamily)